MKLKQNNVLTELPRVGKLRRKQIAPFTGVSDETWRVLGLKGLAPPPIRLSPRCTLYDAAEVHRWIEDPKNYTYPAK